MRIAIARYLANLAWRIGGGSCIWTPCPSGIRLIAPSQVINPQVMNGCHIDGALGSVVA